MVAYRLRIHFLNCSPLSSMFLKRSKLAQQGLSRTVLPGVAILKHSSTQSFMLFTSAIGMPKLSKAACSLVLSTPRNTSPMHFSLTRLNLYE